MNQYTAVGGVSYRYDKNGNLTDDGTYKYYYDCENRLTDVNDINDDPIASYKYDFAGRRVLRFTSHDSRTTKYCYDGLQLDGGTDACIDAANGSAAPSTDILGLRRFDNNYVINTGTCDPPYADMGAYESGPRIVVMCWIDESRLPCPGCAIYYFDASLYDTHLAKYRNIIKKAHVKSGCLVPTLTSGITDVLPEGYGPPAEISVEEFSRPPADVNEFKDDFDRIRENMVPDYIVLSVDNSGSMTTENIDPSYSAFKTWLRSNYVGADVITRDGSEGDPFMHQDWVNEMATQIENIIDGL